MVSLLVAELALSAWGPLAGTEVMDAPAQGRDKNALHSGRSKGRKK
ncbi:MAG: hypothetical protein WA741_02940 [Candidatus Sulfotelmatobacter sp.]